MVTLDPFMPVSKSVERALSITKNALERIKQGMAFSRNCLSKQFNHNEAPQKRFDLTKYTGARQRPPELTTEQQPANHERQKEIHIPGQSTPGVERQSSKERDRVQASVWSKHEGELEKETLRRERWLPHVLQSTVGQIGGHDQI